MAFEEELSGVKEEQELLLSTMEQQQQQYNLDLLSLERSHLDSVTLMAKQHQEEMQRHAAAVRDTSLNDEVMASQGDGDAQPQCDDTSQSKGSRLVQIYAYKLAACHAEWDMMRVKAGEEVRDVLSEVEACAKLWNEAQCALQEEMMEREHMWQQRSRPHTLNPSFLTRHPHLSRCIAWVAKARLRLQ